MNLAKRILEFSLPLARGKLVKRLCVGLGYTFVETSDGRSGIAYTLFERDCCGLIPPQTSFWERPLDLVIRNITSPNSVERTVALAAVNALLNSRKFSSFEEGDVLFRLKLLPEDDVAMVGYFEPLFRKLTHRVRNLWVFERGEGLRPGLLSEAEMPEFLPRATVVLITSVTILNQTLEDVLAQVERARAVVLLGPSTPLAPELFEGTPVTHLSGAVVLDPEKAFRYVAEAKGMPALKEVLKKVVVSVKG